MTRIPFILGMVLWLPSVTFAQSIEIVSPGGDGRIYAPFTDTITVQIDETFKPLAVEIEAEAPLEIELIKKEAVSVAIKSSEPVIAEGDANTLEIILPTKPVPDPIGDALEAGETLRIFDIEFEFDSYSVYSEMRPALQDIGMALQANPELRVVVIGHTDNRGSADYNNVLSLRRAEAVRKALVDWYGIKPGRLSVDGRGFSDPIESNETDWGRARNRRVEIVARR